MNKHTATLDGQTFTRNSKDRTYTHCVVVPNAKFFKGADGWRSIGWCGSPELAARLTAGKSWLEPRILVASMERQ